MLKCLLSCVNVPEKVQQKFLHILFSYLFGLIEKTRAESQVHRLGCSIQALHLVRNGYVLCNCKLFLYACIREGRAVPEAFDFGVKEEDAVILRSLSSSMFVPETPCSVWTPAKLARNERALLKKLSLYVRKFVCKKLIFAVNLPISLNLQDMEIDLFSAGFWALRKNYPRFSSSAHAINVVKQAIHNRGIDLIRQFSDERKNFLSFTLDATSDEREESIDESSSSIYDRIDDKVSLGRLQSGLRGQDARFLALARGNYDKDFSEFLGENNEDFANSNVKNYNVYLDHIGKFLQISDLQRENLFKKLRDSMGGLAVR